MQSGPIGWIRQSLANPLFLYILIAIIFVLGIGHYLGAHPAGLSAAELSTKNTSSSISQIFHKPINAPHHLIAYILHLIGVSWAASLRLSSGLFWLAFCLAFYVLAKSWFGKGIGLMGTLLFASTPIFLIMARDGSAAVMLFATAMVSALYVLAIRSESQFKLFGLVIACALTLYIPGLLIWLIVSAFICRKKLSAIFEDVDPPIIVATILIAILIIVPLVAGLIRDPSMTKPLLLIPTHWPDPIQALKSIAWMTLALFIKAPHISLFEVGRLSILNIIADALLLFGAFALFNAARLKLFALIGAILYPIILASLNDNVSILALAVPALAIIMTAGLRYLFVEWRSVFPRNPLAKNLALSLMWGLVIIQLIFGLRYAASVWPAADSTRQAYVLK